MKNEIFRKMGGLGTYNIKQSDTNYKIKRKNTHVLTHVDPELYVLCPR